MYTSGTACENSSDCSEGRPCTLATIGGFNGAVSTGICYSSYTCEREGGWVDQEISGTDTTWDLYCNLSESDVL